jgi:hypothetical protein
MPEISDERLQIIAEKPGESGAMARELLARRGPDRADDALRAFVASQETLPAEMQLTQEQVIQLAVETAADAGDDTTPAADPGLRGRIVAVVQACLDEDREDDYAEEISASILALLPTTLLDLDADLEARGVPADDVCRALIRERLEDEHGVTRRSNPFPATGLEPRGCPTPGACSCPVPAGPVMPVEPSEAQEVLIEAANDVIRLAESWRRPVQVFRTDAEVERDERVFEELDKAADILRAALAAEGAR